MSVERMMKAHELFHSLGFEEVEAVSRFAGPKPFKKGECVFRSGDPGSHFFVVTKGRVNLKLPSADKESNLLVGRMEKGDIFGLSPFLGIKRYGATAECAEGCTVLAIEVAPFLKLLRANPTVGMQVMSTVAKAYFSRYTETLQRFQNIVQELASA